MTPAPPARRKASLLAKAIGSPIDRLDTLATEHLADSLFATDRVREILGELLERQVSLTKDRAHCMTALHNKVQERCRLSVCQLNKMLSNENSPHSGFERRYQRKSGQLTMGGDILPSATGGQDMWGRRVASYFDYFGLSVAAALYVTKIADR